MRIVLEREENVSDCANSNPKNNANQGKNGAR